MAKAGVGRAAVTSLRGLNADARKGNDHLFAGVAPDQRLLPLGVVGPRVSAAELPSAVESCVTSGAVGLAFHVPPNTSLASLASRRAFAEIARPGLPLVACNLVGEGLPTQLAELTSDLGCALYLAGAFYIIFEEVLAVVEEHDHVYVDPSWFPTPGAVELLVEPGRARPRALRLRRDAAPHAADAQPGARRRRGRCGQAEDTRRKRAEAIRAARGGRPRRSRGRSPARRRDARDARH